MEDKTSKETLIIKPGKMTLADLRKVYEKPLKINLSEDSYKAMEESLAYIKSVAKNRVAYGVNTGIGILASKNISIDDQEILQHNIVLSHAVGVGNPADNGVVRLILVLKINSLALGYSAVRPELVNALITLVNEEVFPHIPVKGSVGASGDLAPLSHMASVLLGEGKAWCDGKWIEATEALHKAGLKPMKLGTREGVALINGTQASTAFALKGLFDIEDMFAASLVCGAMSVDAALGLRNAFDERLHKVKGHKGQMDVAKAYRDLLEESSEISLFYKDQTRVQDPYSLRCQPQVLGACLTQIRNAASTILIEANSSSDNPVFLPSDDEIISGGNFHAEPIAMAADNLALAIAEIGSISERRTSLLMDKNLSQLPAFLVKNCGVNTGFMTAQVTAAALASENKALAHPSCVDSIPTSANQEDHVSMAAAAGRRLWEMADNVKNILAIEWLSACQALDLREKETSPLLEEAKNILRSQVAFLENDRFMSTDIEIASELIEKKMLGRIVPKGLLPSCDLGSKEGTQNGFLEGS